MLASLPAGASYDSLVHISSQGLWVSTLRGTHQTSNGCITLNSGFTMPGENEGQLRPKSSLDLKDVRTGLQLMKDMAPLPWWCPGYKLKLSEISFKLDLDLDCKFINFVNLHSN